MRTGLLLAALAGAAPVRAQARGPIVMTTVIPKDEAPLGQWLNLIYREAFRRLGLELVYVYLPPRRGEVDADAGNVDGELARGPDYGASHPALVRVEEPAMMLTMSAFTVDPVIRVQGWESLQSARYRIEYRAGFRGPEEQLALFARGASVSSVATTGQGLQKLVAGRTDMYIDLEEYVATRLHDAPFANSERIVKAGVLAKFAVHAYLNRKHAALQPALSAALRDMKKEGLIAKYRAQAEAAAVSAAPPDK